MNIHFLPTGDAKINQFSGEQIGVPQNRDWLRKIPQMMHVSLQYDTELE